jgi:hypothetical protein
MILSQASRITDRQRVWVARNNDDSTFGTIASRWGCKSWVLAGAWGKRYKEEAIAKIPSFED